MYAGQKLRSEAAHTKLPHYAFQKKNCRSAGDLNELKKWCEISNSSSYPFDDDGFPGSYTSGEMLE